MIHLDQLERDELIYTFFDRQFFRKYKNNYPENEYSKLEIIVTPECNYQCDYCYIFRHGDKLYPSGIRDHNTIINNLKLLLSWIQDNQYFIYDFDIFSGEFFAGQFGLKILDVIYEYAKKRKFCNWIMIPTNFSFINNDVLTEKVEMNIQRFEKLDIKLILSCSIDGKETDEEARENSGNFRNDAYYDKVFKFCKKYNFGFHPMISTHFIDHYEETYSWWIKNIKKYFGDEAKYFKPMFLEVRNDDWVGNYLEKFKNFLWFEFETDLKELYNYNIEEMTRNLFIVPGTNSNFFSENLKLPLPEPKLSCAIQANPAIRLGDLAIVPCHRTSYDNLIYGYFKVEDNKITGIKEKNLPLALKIYSINPNVSHPLCSDCKIKKICMKGCLGSQLETNGELFMPIKSVCNLFFTKLSTLRDIFEYYDMFNIIYKQKDLSTDFKNHVKEVEKILCQI